MNRDPDDVQANLKEKNVKKYVGKIRSAYLKRLRTGYGISSSNQMFIPVISVSWEIILRKT